MNTIEQAREVSARLHLGASIANIRGIDKDFAILASEAADAIDALIDFVALVQSRKTFIDMLMERQTLQLALEALESRCGTNADERKVLIPAIKAALAKPVVNGSLTTQTTCQWTPMDSDDMPGTYESACGKPVEVVG